MADADDESFLYGDGGEESQDQPQPQETLPNQEQSENGQAETEEALGAPLEQQEEGGGEPPPTEDHLHETGDTNPDSAAAEANLDASEAAVQGSEEAAAAAAGSDEESDDDDDEDGIQITIDREKIDEAKTSFRVNKNVRLPPGEKKGKFAVEEFEQMGAINGQAPHEFDIESMEEKPWKKPGADITDYFNYGFTEETWQAYCQRQRKMRISESGGPIPGVPNTILTRPFPAPGIGGTAAASGTAPVVQNRLPTVLNRTTTAPVVPRTNLPPPVSIRKDGGSGPSSTASPSTKPPEVKSISVMTADKRNPHHSAPPPPAPTAPLDIDFSRPPPIGIPPPSLPPPPTFDGPPPSVNPMGDYPAEDPFGQGIDYDFSGGGYEPTMESQWGAPPSHGRVAPPRDGDAPPGDPTYDEGHRERDPWRERGSRERASRDERERYERDRRAHEYERERAERKRRRSRSRSRERDRYREYRSERDRDRMERDRERESSRSERGERDRDRDRERERDRDRDRERERERSSERRSKRDRSRSRSPSSHSSSRHKKSKKEKRDRGDREIKKEPVEVKQEPAD